MSKGWLILGFLVLCAQSTAQAVDDSFTFVVISDAKYDPAPVYGEIAALSPPPVFLLQIGDLFHSDPAGIRSRFYPKVYAWRQAYKRALYFSEHGQDWQTDIVPNFTVYHIWDDHDYGKNNATGRASWKGLARKAFLDYFPDQPYANPNNGLYFTFFSGPAQFFVLDTRFQRYPNKDTMLGPQQLNWLQEELLNSTAAWKFIITSVPWNSTVVKAHDHDSWEGFPEEAAIITDFIQAKGITGIIFISGDLHSGGAIDDGTYAGFPEISVPITNNWGQGSNCTAKYCGDWSEGIYSNKLINGGYVLITVEGNCVFLQTIAQGTDGAPLTKELQVCL